MAHVRSLDEYPRRKKYAIVAWKFLFKLPGGHSYFTDPEGFVGVADDSGDSPDETEDGCLYVIRDRPITIEKHGSISVVDTMGETHSIVESPRNALDVALRLDMKITIGAGRFFSINRCD